MSDLVFSLQMLRPTFFELQEATGLLLTKDREPDLEDLVVANLAITREVCYLVEQGRSDQQIAAEIRPYGFDDEEVAMLIQAARKIVAIHIEAELEAEDRVAGIMAIGTMIASLGLVLGIFWILEKCMKWIKF